MSEALYERYKDALRRGHVAAMRGRFAEALEAYGEAAGIAPDRALPLTGIAGVLLRLGKRAEALATFDAALDRAPSDEAALRGRADLLVSNGDRVGAAETLDRLAAALDAAGRLPAAADAARRALELAESRGRRSAVRGYVARLQEATDDPDAVEALARSSAVLDTGLGGAAALAAGGDIPKELPFDPSEAIGAVEEAAAGDDPARTRTLALAAAEGHRAVNQASTAIDACYIALAGSPADAMLHITLAELYLDQGWRTLAADKLLLLHRLATLTEDAETIDRVRTLATARLADEPRITDLVA
jgi:tetratricopeptide (TPR) repeat protein